MSSQARQQTSKIHPSKSFLKLIESSTIGQFDKNDSATKITRARSGLKSTLKSRKLADLIDTGKNNASYRSQNLSHYHHDTQKSFQTGHNYLVESFNRSNTQSRSNSNSPKRGSQNKTQIISKGQDRSKIIKISSETDRKSVERFTPNKIIESRQQNKGIIFHFGRE